MKKPISMLFLCTAILALTSAVFGQMAEQRLDSLIMVNNFISNSRDENSVGHIWKKLPWSDPVFNNEASIFYYRSRMGIPAGDLNGNGFNDFVLTLLIPDERSTEYGHRVSKSFFYYGGENLSMDYDHMLYGRFIPAGDLTCNGFGDGLFYDENANLIFYTGSDTGPVPMPGNSISPTVLHWIYTKGRESIYLQDFNGDGCDDLIYSDYNLDLSIVFGNADAGEIKVINLFGHLPTGRGYRFLGVIPVKDVPYFIYSYPESGIPKIKVAKLNENETALETVQTLNSSVSLPYFFAISVIDDFSGNGQPELIINGNHGYLIYYLSEEEDILFKDDPLLIPDESGNSEFVGDLNGDGKPNFLARNNDWELELVTLDVENESVIKELFPIQGTLFSTGRTGPLAAFQGSHSPQVTGFSSDHDREWTFIAGKKNDGLGYTRFERTKDPIETRYLTTALGDIDGDGVDDFGVELNSTADSLQVEIHFGGTGFDMESTSIPFERGSVKGIIAGNFKDPDRRDIAVLFQGSGLRYYEPHQDIYYSSLSFYKGGSRSFGEPYLIIKNSDLFSDWAISDFNTNLFTVSNVGDITNNGFDDLIIGFPGLIISPGNAVDRVWLYQGGPNLNSSPDLEINIGDMGYLISTTGIGSTIQGVGDVNGDGIDDFIVVDPYRQISPKVTSSRFAGAAYLFPGQDGTTGDIQFNEPIAVLLPDTTNHFAGNTSYWNHGLGEITSGDFNGNGYRDIAIKPMRHSNWTITDGIEAIHIYYGPDFKSIPDKKLPIPADLIMINNTKNYTNVPVMVRHMMKAIPASDGSGPDKILLVGGKDFNHALLLDPLATEEEYILARFINPVKPQSMLMVEQSFNVQYSLPLGDFNGDGKLNLIAHVLNHDYRDNPLFFWDVSSLATSVEPVIDAGLPAHIKLAQNFPNPFNPTTLIRYWLPEQSETRLEVYDILGRKVATLVNGLVNAGSHDFRFDASHLSSGIYFYRLSSNGQTYQRSMALVK